MGSRTEVIDTKLINVEVARRLKLAYLKVTLAADNFVIDEDMPPALYIDPAAAARDVLLPAIAGNEGLTFIIFNTSDNATGTEDITLKTSADGAITPSPVISKNEGAVVTNDGVGWRVIVGPNT